MQILSYDERYRDDMIFMVLQAKDALGRKPTINEDLLDITANYLERGDAFYIAIDENDRVVGCIGYSQIEDTTVAFLHRLYVSRKCISARQKSNGLRHTPFIPKTAIANTNRDT